MVHDVYDAEVWAMIDEEDALLASHQEEIYEYLKDEKGIINDTQKSTEKKYPHKGTIRRIRNALQRIGS